MEYLALELYMSLPFQHRLSGGAIMIGLGFCGTASSTAVNMSSLNNEATTATLGYMILDLVTQPNASSIFGDLIDKEANINAENITTLSDEASTRASDLMYGDSLGANAFRASSQYLSAQQASNIAWSLREIQHGRSCNHAG